MSWNVRGLGRADKRRRVRQVMQDRNVDVLLLQETKKSSTEEMFVRSFWPWERMEFMAVDSEASAGGLLSIWNPEVFQLLDCCCHRNFLLILGIALSSFECVFINVYGPNDVSKRALLWDTIINIRTSFQKPWCMGGDYNEIRNIEDRRGCVRRDRGMLEFNNFIDQLELVEVPMLGSRFTWCNSMEGERWSKIDRFLLDAIWLEKFRFQMWGLPRLVSEHCPLLLMEDKRNWGPRPFRFLNAWTLYPGFLSAAKRAWSEHQVQGWACYRVQRRLGGMKVELKKWNIEVFGLVEEQLKKAEEELHAYDLLAESRELASIEIESRREAKHLVWKLRKRKDWLWFQKSKLNWAQHGDRNMRYFHICASKRQRRNMVDSVVVNGVSIEDPELVRLEVVRHLSKAFAEEWPSRPMMFGNFASIGNVYRGEVLEPEFTMEEVWEVVKGV
ncbi:uncharacterized protein LOC114284558 [Camellia sinensis]|uniref:uncharacterized protein LOC114284558 n=1 Tax=Camellia sinensis TaxID=4442 RepID=UPI0010359931|nr:uncharacterized protein LOC114284558 [Camellia sinensis]